MTRLVRLFFLVSASVLITAATSYGQTTPPPRQPEDDVVRINTELVQSDVMVFDKRGRVVDQLKPEQFQLVIDHQPQPIAFFEHVTANSRGQQGSKTANDLSSTTAARTHRGRIVLFFVDDLHLAPDSLVRTRKALLDFVNGGI